MSIDVDNFDFNLKGKNVIFNSFGHEGKICRALSNVKSLSSHETLNKNCHDFLDRGRQKKLIHTECSNDSFKCEVINYSTHIPDFIFSHCTCFVTALCSAYCDL